MNGKLTLTLDKTLIEEAKKFSKNSGQSLSEIVGGFLSAKLQNPEAPQENTEITPIVSELMGAFTELKKSAATKKPAPKPAAKTVTKRTPKTEK